MIINHVLQNYNGEKWKKVVFDFEYVNDNTIEISSFGRVRSFNKTSNGNILKPSIINGYHIIHLKFFKARNETTDKKLGILQKQQLKLTQQIASMKENKESKAMIAEAEKLLETSKKTLKKKFYDAALKRTINYHSLIHRLVATYFLAPPSEGQIIVAHKDYNKLNNRFNNLKWMTPEENSIHQQKSPLVIESRLGYRDRRPENSKVAKLSVTKVMLLKKLLNQGKPIKQMVKQFKVTDTQILRIKRGENWGDIKAAQ